MANEITFDTVTLAVIMCPPVNMFPVPPPEQPNCEKTTCSDCNQLIWISEKKRNIRDSRSKEASYIVCYVCLKRKALTDAEFFDNYIKVNL